MADMRMQAVMGVVPPQVAEAVIVVRWPSVAAYPAASKLGASMQNTAFALNRFWMERPARLTAGMTIPWLRGTLTILMVLALFTVLFPASVALGLAAWAMLAPFYFSKILPFLATRYTLTNVRLMIQRGLKPKASQEVKLGEIEEVRVVPGSEQPFYRAADLEIISGGRAVMTLKGVPGYQAFKINIESAYLAWGRKAPPQEQVHPAK